MSRPVSYNLINKKLENDISIAEMPEGHQGEGFFATSLNKVIGLARKNSIWPLPFATSCCGIEFMATMGSHYDLGRFGSERVGFSPRQCDLLMVMGTIAKKMGPTLRQVYEQMAEPRWVLSVGACPALIAFTRCSNSSRSSRILRSSASNWPLNRSSFAERANIPAASVG